MMDDGSDVAPTEPDTESDDTSSGEDGPFYDDDGVYIDRLRAFRMLHTHREISASGTNIHLVCLEDQARSCCNILQHCKNQIDDVRDEYGGKVCIFKIGVTANPLVRFSYYRVQNFDSMRLIHISECAHLVYMLEAALIQSYGTTAGCRNEVLGGEGIMHLSPPPYYAYVVVARGDGRLRIGS